MNTITTYASRPLAFFWRYIARHPFGHAAIFLSVLAAVGCSVSQQYGIKFLIDTLASGPAAAHLWQAFALLVVLMLGDMLLWRIGGLFASRTFVAVTGDVRGDLFRHLTGHAPHFFNERLPGMLSGRVTATSNAVFTVENMFMWNVLPPCLATIGAIAYLALVSPVMTATLAAVAVILVMILFRLATAGTPLHRGFADKAARVDGEMVDVIGNMQLVRAFGALTREHRRFDAAVGQEMAARRKSLVYLEKLRIIHAGITIVLIFVLLGWALLMWQHGAATTGDVVLVCTLGFTILHATRDLAVALVDVTQHMARLSEAIETLLVPHALTDHPEAAVFRPVDHGVVFDRVSFAYPGGREVFRDFSLRFAAGRRTGLVGLSGGGKSTLFMLLQRFHAVQGGRIMIDGQDIARLKEDSLRDAIAYVPQDLSMLHRSVLENIRYGRPEASDADVAAAARAALCDDFIAALPRGIDTIVGDRGVMLSGGQRQRIAIARALLKDSPILLLDEATSSLDPESEETVRAALDRLMRGRTVIAIAHRLATLRGFDRIVVLGEGRVVQDGTPHDLSRRDGAYRDLLVREMTRLGQRAA
ncbi:MAG TPA: ABC transporter ATP-binding protein [Stellaceae bacterium]|nr:ABC transporter ATP-binding protein [Stellaceae bacterium]